MLRAAHVGVSKKHLVKSKRRTSTPSRKRKNLDPDDDQFISGKDLKISTSNSVSKVKEIALSEVHP